MSFTPLGVRRLSLATVCKQEKRALMPNNHFDDMEKDLNTMRGVFAGSEGWTAQERISEEPDRNGMNFVCTCSNCGKKMKVTIPWLELIPASVGVTPMDLSTHTAWIFQDGFLYPPITCGCGRPIHIPITPDKADRYCQTAVKMRLFTEQQYRAKQAESQQLAGMMRR